MSSERTSENIENQENPSTIEVASKETKPSEGWTWLYNTPKWHYFVDQESLCRKWILFTKGAYLEPEMRSRHSSEYCKICQKKLKSMRPVL